MAVPPTAYIHCSSLYQRRLIGRAAAQQPTPSDQQHATTSPRAREPRATVSVCERWSVSCTSAQIHSARARKRIRLLLFYYYSIIIIISGGSRSTFRQGCGAPYFILRALLLYVHGQYIKYYQF